MKRKPVTVKTLVNVELQFGEWDGLYNEQGDCACLISDLSPDTCMTEDCRAGYKVPCDCGEGHEYHIVPERLKRRKK